MNFRGLKWVFLIFVMVFYLFLNCGEYWRLEEERDLFISFRGLLGILGFYFGFLYIVWDNFFLFYIVYVFLNGDLLVFRGINLNYIFVFVFWREKTMLYKVVLGESGVIVILFFFYLSTFSLVFGSLLIRFRVCFILCLFLYSFFLWFIFRCRRDVFFVLVYGLWFYFIMNLGWVRDWRCRYRVLIVLIWKGFWECFKFFFIRG